MARGLTIAVYVFCVNVAFTLVGYVNPFHLPVGAETIFSDMGLINTTVSSSMALNATNVGTIGLFGMLTSFISVFGIMINLVLGPLTLVPAIMDHLGFDMFVTYVIASMVWVSYAVLMFQLITGRTLEAVS
jgi:hypothetical protein